MLNADMIYEAADYLRLSKEDGDFSLSNDKLESDSISSQRAIIERFVAQNPNIKLVAEFCDDGYTGTNFDRPDFQRMMEAVKAGKINCVIVKDDCVIIEPTQKDLENQGFVAGSICF